MASPSISEISSPSWLVLMSVSSNSWIISRLCSISVSLTNRVKPLISGIKSSPLVSIFLLKLRLFGLPQTHFIVLRRAGYFKVHEAHPSVLVTVFDGIHLVGVHLFLLLAEQHV